MDIKEFKEKYLWQSIVGALALLLLISYFTNGFAFMRGGITGGATKSGVADVDFYVMSQCPYGVQVEESIKPLLDKFGESIDFSLNFIAQDLGNGKFDSLHGEAEVKEDIRQLCAAKYYPKNYMEYISCQNENIRTAETTWERCAQKNKLDIATIKSCAEGDEGKLLMSESVKAADAVDAMGSPTIYVNGEPYNGGRDTNSFLRAICLGLKNHPECQDMPECGTNADCTPQEGKIGICEEGECQYIDQVKFTLTIVNDKNCNSCDTTSILQTSNQLFPGVEIKEVDISSEEGKALVQKYSLTLVPAYLFDSAVTTTYMWTAEPDLASAFEKKEDKYKLLDEVTGASRFISEKERQEFYKTVGLTLGDNKPQIDFFVMSYCPYGIQAVDLLNTVYQKLKDKVEFKPHYIIYANYQGGGSNYCMENGKYCSMHGIQELNQDVREMCVNKLFGIGKYFAFATATHTQCTSQNVDTCWEGVAKSLSLDASKIKSCQEQDGISLLAKDKEIGDKLKVSGSPTVFIEGEQYGGARTANGYQAALCSSFTTAPSECSSTIEETSDEAMPSGGCGA